MRGSNTVDLKNEILSFNVMRLSSLYIYYQNVTHARLYGSQRNLQKQTTIEVYLRIGDTKNVQSHSRIIRCIEVFISFARYLFMCMKINCTLLAFSISFSWLESKPHQKTNYRIQFGEYKRFCLGRLNNRQNNTLR